MDPSAFMQRCWIPDGAELGMSLAHRSLPHSMLYVGQITPSVQRWPRGSASDHVHVGVILKGSMRLATAVGSREYRTGDLYVFPRWEWTRTRVHEETEFVHVATTHRALIERAIDVSPTWLERSFDSPMADQLRAVATTAVSSPRHDDLTDAVIDRIIIVILQAILGAHHRPAVNPFLCTLRQRADAYIEAFHTDPDLTPRRLAEDLGVSLRQLQRAFTTTGGSVAARLRERRTTAALNLLSLENTRFLPVQDIARMAGFSSAYALRSALNSATGATPRRLRQIQARDG
ncbi:helix-turn-helix domain-containing protein [Microbacterium aurum]